MSTPSTGFQLFARERRVRLTTYEREGTPFGHGAQIAVEGDRAYVRTHARARSGSTSSATRKWSWPPPP